MSGRTMQEGAIIMIVLIVLAAVLALLGGMVMDNIYRTFETTGLFASIPNAWDSSSQLLSIINLYYCTCIIIALLGVGIFIQSIYQKDGIDTQMNYYNR